MRTKCCSKCKEIKLIKDFYKDKYKKNGYVSSCKSCCYIITKKYSQSLKGKICQKKYYSSMKGIYNQLKTTSKRKNIIFTLNKKEFVTWYSKQLKQCVYCRRQDYEIIKDYNGRHNRLSIDKKDNFKGYRLYNIVLCCHKCNTIKSDIFTFKEMKKIGIILETKYNQQKEIKWDKTSKFFPKRLKDFVVFT